VQLGDADAEALLALPGARRCPLLVGLPAYELELLLQDAEVVGYRRRDPPSPLPALDDALHVVLRGALFEHVRHPRGGGAYGRPVAAGAAIGLTDVLLDAPLAREACALLPSAVLRVPGGTVRALLRTGDGSAAIATTALRLLAAAQDDRVVLATGDATQRVLRRVGDLVADWGRGTADGIDITLPLTQEQLALWAGASRETTVRILRRLRAQGLVETSRRHLHVVDPEGIAALARDQGVPSAAGSVS
jgi:CRP-like cAMP-binding protein